MYHSDDILKTLNSIKLFHAKSFCTALPRLLFFEPFEIVSKESSLTDTPIETQSKKGGNRWNFLSVNGALFVFDNAIRNIGRSKNSIIPYGQ